MFICPFCHAENLPGADCCAECHADLQRAVAPASSGQSGAGRLRRPVGPIARAPAFIASDATLAAAVEQLRANGGCVLVGSAEQVEGILSERDLLRYLAQRAEPSLFVRAATVMTHDPETVQAGDTIAFALHKMSLGGFRHLPVFDGATCVGLLSVRDAFHALIASDAG